MIPTTIQIPQVRNWGEIKDDLCVRVRETAHQTGYVDQAHGEKVFYFFVILSLSKLILGTEGVVKANTQYDMHSANARATFNEVIRYRINLLQRAEGENPLSDRERLALFTDLTFHMLNTFCLIEMDFKGMFPEPDPKE